MHSTLFLILRRMRAPLIFLIVSYAVSILGLTLIPGVDADGRPAPPMGFFHAFYFISYTATTIGFGEIPMAFSDAQRAWTIVAIYLTVIVWLYSIGTILGLLQEPALQRAIRANRFEARVRRLRQPFYLIAVCGETGILLLQALDSRNQEVVVLDIDPERINELELGQYRQDVPALAADARLPENLIAAGLHHPLCAGVIALTNDDPVNLSVAVTTKLLRPELPILCRADLLETAANMESFGVVDVVNAFEIFGEHLGIAINNPGHHLLYQWLTGVPGEPLAMPMEPPRGTWLVCGYGRFGQAVARHLDKQGIELVVVDEHPPADHEHAVTGRGTEAHTLLEAGIEQAVGIVAGTHDDINNLSIAMTARQLKPGLFIVLRQNRHANAALFERFAAQTTMQPSSIVAHEFLSLLTTPLLPRFFSLALHQGDAWADVALSRIAAVVGDTVPEVWVRELSKTGTLAIWQALNEGRAVRLGDLLRSPSDRNAQLACVPLLLKRGNEEILVPDNEMALLDGDRILFCGESQTRLQQALGLQDYSMLDYLLTGNQAPGGLVWRKMAGHGKA